MPKTKYENINSEQELKKKYEKSLKDVDKRQRADWDNGFKETSEYAEKKKAAMLDFLGADLSDQDFEAFENKLQEEGPAKNLFNRMTNELTAIQIIQHKELFQKALAGDILKLTQKEQEESFEAASQTCRQYDQEKKRRSEKINAAVNEKEARDKRDASQYTMALADGAYDEKRGSDPVTDEQRKSAYVRMAAKLIAIQTIEKDTEKPTGSNCGYDYNTAVLSFQNRETLQKDTEKNLAESKDFAAFVMQQRATGKLAARFKAENLYADWEEYKNKLQDARDEYMDFMEGAKEAINPNNPKNVYPNLLFAADLIDDNLSAEDVKDRCKEVISSEAAPGQYFSMDQFVKAANVIVADTLLSPAAEKSFYDDASIQTNGFIDSKKVNEAFISMRDQVIEDPIFRDVLSTRPSSKNLVGAYKEAVKKEVNKKIRSEKAEKAAYKDNHSKQQALKKFGEETEIEISANEYEQIKETREKLRKFNEGKKPSDHMKRLTEALDKVIEQGKDGGRPKAGALEELNSAALNYYNKRQGILFSPLTDNGKARFATVEKLAFTTDKIHARCKEAYDNKMGVNKNQQKQMGK